MNNTNSQKQKNRLYVANLIQNVLTEKITVNQALSNFPDDKTDINLKCAFDALMHREADEDYRNKVSDYAIVQDEYLADLAEFLKNNQDLPKNIIEEYMRKILEITYFNRMINTYFYI